MFELLNTEVKKGCFLLDATKTTLFGRRGVKHLPRDAASHVGARARVPKANSDALKCNVYGSASAYIL